MNNSKFFRFIIMITILWVLFDIMSAYAEETSDSIQNASSGSDDTIRITIPVSSTDYDDKTKSGYVGYTMDYLQKIAQYTGWQYEVIEVEDTYGNGVQSTFKMISDGTADLIAPIRYYKDTGYGIRFSDNSYITAKLVLQIPNSIYEGTEIKNGVRVAIKSNSGMMDGANEYFSRINVIPEYVQCNDVEDQLNAVLSGKADVMLNYDLEYIPNMSIVAEFSPQHLYFAGIDESIMSELDSAIISIKQADTTFSRKLYDKYFTAVNQQLTLEETKFIQESGIYKVAVLDHNAPYQYYDEDLKKYRGISIDLLNEISLRTGLKFEFTSVGSWDDLASLIENGEIQIIAGMPYDYDFAVSKDLTITKSYVTAPYVLAAKSTFSGISPGQRLALTDSGIYLNDEYTGQIINFTDMDSCFEAVINDGADYTYVDLYTAQYYKNTEPRYNSLDITLQSSNNMHSYCFGITRPTEYKLLSILNKSINQITDSNMQSIITSNISPSGTKTLGGIIRSHPVESLVIIGILGLLIAVMLLVLLWRKIRLSRILRRKAMEDGLTHLYNLSAFKTIVEQSLKKMSNDDIGALLVMDVDNFKNINDEYGHMTGNRTLSQFAGILKDILRDDSIIARIGGDEFSVFLSSIKHEDDIHSICKRICDTMHKLQIGASDKYVTTSIGAVTAVSSDEFNTLFNLADKALYEAKHNAKDQYSIAEKPELTRKIN